MSGQKLSDFITTGQHKLTDEKNKSTNFITIYKDNTTNTTVNDTVTFNQIKAELAKQHYTKDQAKALEPFVTTIDNQQQLTESFKLLMNYVRPIGDYYWNDEAEPDFTELEEKPENWVKDKYYQKITIDQVENYEIISESDFENIETVYIENGPNSPNTLFGGTWVQIKDRFILAAGNEYMAGSADGEAEVKLTIEQMPTHSHLTPTSNGTPSGTDAYKDIEVASVTRSRTNNKGLNYDYELTGYLPSPPVSSTGGSQPHNNMPPYYTTYVWRRTGLYVPANS